MESINLVLDWNTLYDCMASLFDFLISKTCAVILLPTSGCIPLPIDNQLFAKCVRETVVDREGLGPSRVTRFRRNCVLLILYIAHP